MSGTEVFLTSTAGGVMPITRVDDTTFGGGKPEPSRKRSDRLTGSGQSGQK